MMNDFDLKLPDGYSSFSQTLLKDVVSIISSNLTENMKMDELERLFNANPGQFIEDLRNGVKKVFEYHQKRNDIFSSMVLKGINVDLIDTAEFGGQNFFGGNFIAAISSLLSCTDLAIGRNTLAFSNPEGDIVVDKSYIPDKDADGIDHPLYEKPLVRVVIGTDNSRFLGTDEIARLAALTNCAKSDSPLFKQIISHIDDREVAEVLFPNLGYENLRIFINTLLRMF